MPTFCTPGDVQPCYDGPPGTDGVGACHAGQRTCLPDGSAFGPCTGQVLPAAEKCATPEDEDCDGITPPCGPTYVRSAQPHAYHVGVAADVSGAAWLWSVVVGDVAFDGGPTLSDSGTADYVLTHLTPSGNVNDLLRFSNMGKHASAIGSVARRTGSTVLAGGADSLFIGSHQLMGGGFVAELDPTFGLVWDGSIGNFADMAAIDGMGGTCFFSSHACGPLLSGCSMNDDVVANARRTTSTYAQGGFSIGVGGPSSTFYPFDIAAGAQGDQIITGWLHGRVDFGSLSVDVGDDDAVYVVKIDANLSPVWARAFPIAATAPGNWTVTYDLTHSTVPSEAVVTNAGMASGYSVVVLPGGDVVLAAAISGTVDFGGGPITSPGLGLVVVALDAAGNHRWSRLYGGPVFVPPKLAVGPGGEILVSTFVNSVPSSAFPGPGFFDFGGGAPLRGLVVARLAADGRHLGSAAYPAHGMLGYHGLAATGGSVIVAGNATPGLGGIDFGAVGKGDGMFVARLPLP